MDCQYCKKQFSTKSNLLKHQQSAKYCIKLQTENKPVEFICKGCSKTLCSKFRLQTHYQICDQYKEMDKIRQLEDMMEQTKNIIAIKDSTIEKLENHVKELENKLFEIAIKSKGKTTNNGHTYVYNFTPITDEKLKAEAINFTKEHLLLGGQGIARYAIEGPLKDNYLVTDVSRGNTQYMNEDGKIVIDPCSATLTKRICQSIVEPAQKINREVKSTLSGETPDLELTRAVLIEETVSDIRHASKGLENTVTKEFAKTISKSNVKTAN
jgi:hypothetical protein